MLESTKAIIPELTLIVFAFYLTVRSASGKASRNGLFIEALIGAIASLGFLLVYGGKYMDARPFYGMLALDETGFFFRVMFVALAIFVIFITRKSTEVHDYLFGEYLVVILTMTAGMCFVATSADVLMMFLALEWVSLSSYLLTAFIAHKRSSSEAGIKYTLFGGIASAVMLFGISWLFGVTGTLKFEELPAMLSGVNKVPALFSLILILLGFAFKVAAVPLHFWAPDVYQAAPTPVSAFFSIGPKAAGFAVLIRFFYYTFFLTPENEALVGHLKHALEVTIMALAAITMTMGNLLALKQTNLKRLLAYSSVSHAGYLLMGIAAFSDKGVQSVLFYLFAYLLMNGGAFLILTISINKWGTEDIEDYHGLAWRGGHSSLIALGMAVFLFSLAGLPPFAGFIGKWYVFAAAVEKEMYFIVVVGLVNVVISLYYYARIVRAMYLVQEPGPKTPLTINFTEGFWVGTLASLSIYFGIFFAPFFVYLQGIIPG